MRPLEVRRIIALVALLAASALATARAEEPGGAPAPQAGVLAGRVLDDAGHPIVGAEVRLPELARHVLTGADGSYRIEGLPFGRALLVVQRFGYEPVVQEVHIAPPSGEMTLAELRMQTTPFTINPVLVTATRSPIPPMGSPLPSATLFGEPLRRHQTVSLAHAIEALPGVRTLSTGQQVGKPVLRGLTGPRVLVLDDSRRLEDYSWSDEDGPSIDARQVQRVEVVRGPASVLYGSDALGGVVNAVPADLPEAAAGRVSHAAIEAYGASNNLEGGGAVRIESGTPSTGLRLHGILRGSGNLHTPDGELHNTGFIAFNGEGAFGIRGEPGNLTLRYVRYGGEFKLLEKEGPAAPAMEEGPERKLSDDRVQLGGNLFASDGLRLEARGQWQRHNLIEVADDPTAPPGSGVESEQFNLLLNTGTLDLLAHHTVGRLHGSAGVSGLAQANDTRGPIALVPDAHLASGGAFVFEQLDFGQWSLLAGAREDFRSLEADANAQLGIQDQVRHDDRFTGDVGVVFRPQPSLAVSANIGKAYRAPTLFELYANGPHLGEARYEVGDPNLMPEDGVILDGGVRWQSSHFRGEVAAFRNGMNGFIHVVPTTDVIGGLQVFRHEQTDATLYGGEVRVEVEPVNGLTAYGQFETVVGDDVEADQPLPLIPPARGVVGTEYRWGAGKWRDSARLGGDVVMVDEQDRLSPFDTPTAAYALLDLAGGVTEHWYGREVAIDLEVRNVLDTAYRDYLSRYKEFALDPGINALLRVSTGF